MDGAELKFADHLFVSDKLEEAADAELREAWGDLDRDDDASNQVPSDISVVLAVSLIEMAANAWQSMRTRCGSSTSR